MSKTAIITDTDASLPLELAKERNIVQVPIMVQFGDESFRAVYDIDDEQTFARIDKSGKLPTTSAPSPGQFAEAYKAAFDAGCADILCFTVSGEVSATYSAALNAADLFPGKEITVVDTKNLTFAQGFMVLAAAKALDEGKSKDDAIAIALDVGARSHLFAALSTVKYLAMSGRVGTLAAGLANIMNIKPILTMRNGKLDLLERIRTQSKAWQRVVDLTVEAAAGNPIEQMAIVHVHAPEAAKQLEALLRASLPCPKEIRHIALTPGLSVHSGAGLVGSCVVIGK
ncbi:MAG: DegV family protein [Chloroflexi bacterium]|nr:DegV family protein [Chloroflexota bacterium]